MCPNQKAHSASITAGPHAYEAEEKKKKGRTIIELDCRGLEFVEFKADVRPPALAFCSQCEYSSPIPVADWLLLFFSRANGRLKVPSLQLLSLVSTSRKVSGTTTMRRPVRK